MLQKKILSKDQKKFFEKNGYLIFNNFFSKSLINKVKNTVPNLFKGIYDTGISPDKIKWDSNNKKKFQDKFVMFGNQVKLLDN